MKKKTKPVMSAFFMIDIMGMLIGFLANHLAFFVSASILNVSMFSHQQFLFKIQFSTESRKDFPWEPPRFEHVNYDLIAIYIKSCCTYFLTLFAY